GVAMKPRLATTGLAALLGAAACVGSTPATASHVSPTPSGTSFSATPVVDWSKEARRAIVPAGPGGIFGTENFGNKFPGEAAVYMGIVHVAIYDAAVAIEGGLPALRDRGHPDPQRPTAHENGLVRVGRKDLGRSDSATRTPAQTEQALFWT